MTETQIVKTILEWLEKERFYHLRLNTGTLFASYGGKKRAIKLCPNGTPDIFVLVDGRAFFFEVKKDEAEVKKWEKRIENFVKTSFKPSYCNREIEQHKARVQIEKNDGMWYLVCSLEEVQAVVQKHALVPPSCK